MKEATRASEALRQSEERFRTFADTAPAMLWVTEPDGSCSYLSRGWYELTGQTEATGLGSAGSTPSTRRTAPPPARPSWPPT